MQKKNTKNKVIHFSRFVPNTGAGGGARRTRQMANILEVFHPHMISTGRIPGIRDLSPADLGFPVTMALNFYSGRDGALKYWSTFDLETVTNKKKSPVMNKTANYLTGKKWLKSWKGEHRQKVNRLRQISIEWTRRLDLSELCLAIVDDPIFFYPLIKELKKIGIPVTAVSHNLESLLSHQVNRRYQGDLFNREIEALAACDLVIAISREEAWLLKNLDINVVFFPYYPVENIWQRLLTIRKNREKTGKKDFLLIGTAINEATRQGMLTVIDHWKKQELYRGGDRLLVTGFMSDIFLQDIKKEKNIEVLGPLPDEKLDKIMGSIRANIVYQDWGSGALTRIMETLTAGIPVLVNSHAARSYHNMTGVIEFKTLNELGDMFRETEKIEGHIPVPPRPDASFLTAEIEKIMRQPNYFVK